MQPDILSTVISHDGSEHMAPTNANPGDVIGQYRLLEMITSGACGEVWRADTGDNSTLVAVKIMFAVGRSIQASRAQEVGKVLDAARSRTSGSKYLSWVFDSGFHLGHECLFFELQGMSLRKLLNTPYVFPIPSFQVRAILWQICMGVAFLHRLDIVHTDIKPENVVLVEDGIVTVCDINCDGRIYDKSVLKNIQIKIVDLEDSVSCPRNLHFIPGTPGYRPPEVYGKYGWGLPVDVFAVGCLAHELIVGIPLIPYTEDVREYLFSVERVVRCFGSLQAQDICDVYPDIFRTKTRLPRVKVAGMHPKAKGRLLRYISDTKWRQKGVTEPDMRNFITSCTRVDPHQRLSTESVIRHRIFADFSRAHRM